MLDRQQGSVIITLGDPFSTNIELLCRSYPRNFRKNIIIIGSWWHFCRQQKELRLSFPLRLERTCPGGILPEKSCFIDITPDSSFHLPASSLTPVQRGLLATLALKELESFSWNASRQLAVLTCPIDKAACQLAGFGFPGQTEYFTHLWGGESIMLMHGRSFRVGIATNHLAVSQIHVKLTSQLLESKIDALISTLRNVFQKASPSIAILSLNPHGGDEGLFGQEETALIQPLLAKLRKKYLGEAELVGILPADTAFHHAMITDTYDALLAMYHDQGLAPFKTVHGFEGINITGGLRFLRLSPDHGPGQALFLKNQANMSGYQLCWEMISGEGNKTK